MSFSRVAGRALSALCGLALCVPACGNNERPPAAFDTTKAGSGGAAPGLGGLAGSVGTGGDDIGDTCAGQLVEAQHLPLDMYVMLDVSGSMLAPTEGDPTTSKWQAVSAALSAFVSDDASDGMGMGLQVFPIRHPDAPTSCSSNADCGAEFGPCVNRACWPLVDGELTPCLDSGACLIGQSCIVYGECANDPRYVCDPAQIQDCSMDLGACAPPPSPCLATADCRPVTYAAPAAAIAELPAARDALIAVLSGTEPDPEGGTPTGPALQGALAQAAEWAATHGDRQAVAVLATDGLPTLCAPVSIPQVANVARAAVLATPSVSTFVIGVIGPDDRGAADNLDTIAQAGGTEAAFIVDTQGDVTLQFRDALDEIRASRLSCDLLVPEAEPGKPVDYERVNVVLDGAGGPLTLGYARDWSGCDADPTQGGWYYDQDPDDGGVPGHILICPAACERFKQPGAGSVQIKLGCRRRDVVK